MAADLDGLNLRQRALAEWCAAGSEAERHFAFDRVSSSEAAPALQWVAEHCSLDQATAMVALEKAEPDCFFGCDDLAHYLARNRYRSSDGWWEVVETVLRRHAEGAYPSRAIAHPSDESAFVLTREIWDEWVERSGPAPFVDPGELLGRRAGAEVNSWHLTTDRFDQLARICAWFGGNIGEHPSRRDLVLPESEGEPSPDRQARDAELATLPQSREVENAGAHGMATDSRGSLTPRGRTVEEVLEQDTELMVRCIHPYDFGRFAFAQRLAERPPGCRSSRDRTRFFLANIRPLERTMVLVFEALTLAFSPTLRFFSAAGSGPQTFEGRSAVGIDVMTSGNGQVYTALIASGDERAHLFERSLRFGSRADRSAADPTWLGAVPVEWLDPVVEARGRALDLDLAMDEVWQMAGLVRRTLPLRVRLGRAFRLVR